MTNYEKIKQMSVEEMSATIMCPNDCGLAEFKCGKTDSCNCYECIKQWLQQEVEK